MSTRARGDHDWPRTTAWRPPRSTGSRPDLSERAGEDEVGGELHPEVGGNDMQWLPRRRRLWLAVAMLAAAAIAVAAAPSGRRAHPVARAAYPTTPRAWFDAYMAAAVDDPTRVCHVLFTPELVATYRDSSAGSCENYFADVQDSAVQIARIVQSHSTAVIELRQRRAPRYRWNAVLARIAGGWRAVALVGGR